MNDVDKQALELAIEQTLAEPDEGRVEQVKSMLADETRTWFETASFCSYHRQNQNLRLAPWDSPACDICDDDVESFIRPGPGHETDVELVKLYLEMREYGVSKFHPDPAAAVRAAKAAAGD